MASYPTFLLKPLQSKDSPYCSDPNCESCKELRAMHEAIRLDKPLPKNRHSESINWLQLYSGLQA
jgi:hypothetical protein